MNGNELVETTGFVAVDMAVREYAPCALEAAGLAEHAAALRALPEIVDAVCAARVMEAMAAARAELAAEAARRELADARELVDAEARATATLTAAARAARAAAKGSTQDAAFWAADGR